MKRALINNAEEIAELISKADELISESRYEEAWTVLCDAKSYQQTGHGKKSHKAGIMKFEITYPK